MKIKSILSILFCLAFCFNVSAQKDISLDFYDKGVKEFQSKNFIVADSLFTLSIKAKPHPDTYYSRAAVRYKMNDKKGYCADLYSASVLNDKESDSIYWKNCTKKEIKYYTKNEVLTDENNYTYKETTLTGLYLKTIKYRKVDVNNKVVLVYEITNSDTIFKSKKDTILPKYIGGEAELFYFISKSIVYPNRAKNKGYSGAVYVQFTVNEMGEVVEEKVVKGVKGAPELDEEALRVIKTLPNWIPATCQDENVSYVLTLPLRFALR